MPVRFKIALLSMAIVTFVGFQGCDSTPAPAPGGNTSVAAGGGITDEQKAKAAPPPESKKKGGGAPIMPGR